jgi:hypothetical protein
MAISSRLKKRAEGKSPDLTQTVEPEAKKAGDDSNHLSLSQMPANAQTASRSLQLK